MMDHSFVLNLTCPDAMGIVNAVSGWLVERQCNILESAQFGDPNTGLFAMRIQFQAEERDQTSEQLQTDFDRLAKHFGMTWNLRETNYRPRVLIMVSRQDHCLHDLLYRYSIGELNIEIPAVISNHPDVGELVASHDINFKHWPAEPNNRNKWDDKLLQLIEDERIDFVVLARYMQIISQVVCDSLPARIINIHHSFLPGFKGARPYAQAYERGVKVIGATAHYVSPELDEGPIIEQDVVRVDHSMSAEELAAVGRDIEKIVLARAVRYQAELRVVLDGMKTIVFR
jgi:formyltetrahydrofolate deformylase